MNEKIILRRPRKLKAFTLLEMIVVLAIIAILSAIIIPSTIDQIRSSKIESANTRAEEIYMAAQNFLTDMQIKRVALVGTDATTAKSAAFPLYTAASGTSVHKVGATIYVDDSGTWKIGADCTVIGASSVSETCKYQSGISNYLGTTTLESLNGAAFFIYFDIDTYTVDCVLYNDQADDVGTTATESVTYVNTMASAIDSGSAYTQVYGKPASGGKSQEYDTNMFLSGKTSGGCVPYVGQYPVPYNG